MVSGWGNFPAKKVSEASLDYINKQENSEKKQEASSVEILSQSDKYFAV